MDETGNSSNHVLQKNLPALISPDSSFFLCQKIPLVMAARRPGDALIVVRAVPAETLMNDPQIESEGEIEVVVEREGVILRWI